MTPLDRYRWAARIVGVALVLLVVVAIPLQIAGAPLLEKIIGPLHGLLYLGYLATILDLRRHVRLTGWQVVAMIGAGLVPFLTFVVERRISARLSSENSQV